jgi:hypothetical protein
MNFLIIFGTINFDFGFLNLALYGLIIVINPNSVVYYNFYSSCRGTAGKVVRPTWIVPKEIKSQSLEKQE